MSATDLKARTMAIIAAVLELIKACGTFETAAHRESATRALDLCKDYLMALRSQQEVAGQPVALENKPAPASTGQDRYEIARRIGVSTLFLDELEAKAPPDLSARIAELAAEGMGVRAIARELKVNPSTVSRRLRKMQEGEENDGGKGWT